MLRFEEVMIYTGKKNKVSKQGNNYTIVNYLNSDGTTFGTIAECEIPEDIRQLDEVIVKFEVIPGRYVQLKTVGIEKVR